MRVLSGLNESVAPVVAEEQFGQDEQQIVNDILSGLNEGPGSILDKVKAYANKGLLTAGIIAALMAAPNLSNAQKSEIKQVAGTTQSQGRGQESKFNIRQVSPAEQDQWNRFLNFVDSAGYKGSKELDVRNKNLGATLFSQFKQQNPDITIDYSIVPSVQNALRQIHQFNLDFQKRHGNQVDDNTAFSGVSKVDGWFGSLTSQYKFPTASYNEYQNGNLVKSQDLGFVKSDGGHTGATANSSGSASGTYTQGQKAGEFPQHLLNKLPRGVKPEKGSDGKWYYEDPHTGDLVAVKGI